ncbi:F-box/kelch-repeat protein At3g23880-like [Apium graveolens]|uniref:F-box/kelch-repeat protein At3g23880-like n=1 Tax=Apium graveolens TaxID=4045 RepID=UPI003D793781
MGSKIVTKIGVLPGELLTKVLVQLPVKTLGVCKSVCKPWLSLISSPDFINSHLRYVIHNYNNNPTLLNILDPNSGKVVHDVPQVVPINGDMPALPDWVHTMYALLGSFEEAVYLLSMRYDRDGHDLSSCQIRFDRVVIPSFFQHSRVVGASCCNGIVCLTDDNIVYLWNPLIRRCKQVRVPELDVASLSGVRIGFGYDSGLNDYKVFRTLWEGNLDSVMLKLQVYSVNNDSWGEFQGPVWGKNLGEEKFKGNDFVVVKETLYLSSWDEQHLIAFDLRTEVIGLVSFPSFVQKKLSDVMDFEGYISVVFESVSGIDLWKLNDNVSGQGSSWTKMFTIAPDDPHPKLKMWLSCYLGAGQFFGKKLLNGNVFMYNVLYDCEKKETKYYGVGLENVLATLKYRETLVSLDGFHQVEENAN